MPVGIRPSLARAPRAGRLPHAHKMRERRPATMLLLAETAGPEETQYGYSWIDGHLPAQADEATSLMDEAEIARCAQGAIAGGAKYLGAKVCVPKDASLEQRLAMLTNIYRACGLGE